MRRHGSRGFVGSHLCELLLSQGDEVIGIDCFTDYYDPRRKETEPGRGAAVRPVPAAPRGPPPRTAGRDLLEWRRRRVPPRGPAGGAPVLGFGLRDLRLAQRPGDPGPPRGRTGRRPREAGLCLELERLWRRRVLPDGRDAATATGVALRRDETGRGAPLRALPRGLRGAHRLPPPVHRVRPAAAPRHGLLAAGRRRPPRRHLRALRRGHPDPRLHLRRRTSWVRCAVPHGRRSPVWPTSAAAAAPR